MVVSFDRVRPCSRLLPPACHTVTIPVTTAARFAVRVLDDQPQAGVLIHCSAGRRRSAMLAYAVLRLRGHDRTRAAALVLRYRPQAQLVPAYVRSVERWLADFSRPAIDGR